MEHKSRTVASLALLIVSACTPSTPSPTPAPGCARAVAVIGGSGMSGWHAGIRAVKPVAASTCTLRFVDFPAQSEEDRAVDQARGIVSDGDVVGVIGSFSSRITRFALPIFREAGLPVISPTGEELDEPVFHRLLPTRQAHADAVARYVKGLSAQRILLIDDRSAEAPVVVAALEQALGPRIIGRLTLLEHMADALLGTELAAANSLQQTGVDLVVLAGVDYVRAAWFVGKLGGLGLRPTFVTATWGMPDPPGEALVVCPCSPPGDLGPEGSLAATAYLDAMAAGKSTRSDIQAFLQDHFKPSDSFWVYQLTGRRLVNPAPVR